MGGVFGVLILFGSYMAGVICLAEVQPASLTGISNVSAILGFLIVFRFNQVYVMFSKSRTHVGELLSSVRKVALHVNSMWRGNLSLDEAGRARTYKEVDRLYHHNHGSVHPERTHAWMDRPRRQGAASGAGQNRAGQRSEQNGAGREVVEDEALRREVLRGPRVDRERAPLAPAEFIMG